MSDNKQATSETETILMALDQISQTIDVMTSVVSRLRTYMREQESIRKQESTTGQGLEQADANRTVH